MLRYRRTDAQMAPGAQARVVQEDCKECDGEGGCHTTGRKCPYCNGRGVIEVEYVPPGYISPQGRSWLNGLSTTQRRLLDSL